jgi:glycosyltransferase involved in cell wall biosynthesis
VFARSIGMRNAVHFTDLGADLTGAAPAIDVWLSLPGGARDGTALDPAVAAGAFAPLIAAEGSLAASLIERGVDGLLARPPNDLAARLIDLLEHDDRRRDLAVAARVRHASTSRREAFMGAVQAFEARASIRAASALAASK